MERIVPDAMATYDVLLCAVGYEARAVHVAKSLVHRVGRVWGFDYARERVLSYDRNAAYFTALSTFEALPDSDHRRVLRDRLSSFHATQDVDAATGERPVMRVAVDFSCMDRDALAATVLALTLDQDSPMLVDFYYSFGVFDENLKGSEGTVMVNRPAYGFEGWPSDPDAGLVCLLGLGFESRLALAAIETLEPANTIALVPIGEDHRYDAVVVERNGELLSSGQGIGQYKYQVSDIYQTVVDLDASVTALTRRGRVVLVPLGPKPLALAAMLVALAHETDVTVWRLSAANARKPEDRWPSGTIVGLGLWWPGTRTAE